jgi:hypothetical protein
MLMERCPNMNVFFDSCIVNDLIDIDKPKCNLPLQENAKYIELIIKSPSVVGIVSPTVKRQLEMTPDKKRREELISKYNEFHFKEFIGGLEFPLRFPLTFMSKKQEDIITELHEKRPPLRPDLDIIRDAAFIKDIDVLLTADKKLAGLKMIGKVKFLLPKELWDVIETGLS